MSRKYAVEGQITEWSTEYEPIAIGTHSLVEAFIERIEIEIDGITSRFRATSTTATQTHGARIFPALARDLSAPPPSAVIRIEIEIADGGDEEGD